MAERSPYPRMAAALLALIGLLDSIYLSLSRLNLSDLSCPIGGGCDTVQAHAWSTIPPGTGIPISYIGVGGYFLMFVLSLLALHTDTIGSMSLPPILLAIGVFAVVMGVSLTGVQIFVIEALCFWCVMSAVLGLLFSTAAFLDWRAWRTHHASSSVHRLHHQHSDGS